MTSLEGGALLAATGVVAGIVGTAGGITTLVSYPALLLVGVPALPASVANTVAVVACLPGSAVASRPELVGRWIWVARTAIVVALGAIAGAGLLLTTPSGLFGDLVPFLLLAGSVALVAQPWLAHVADAHLGSAGRPLLLIGLFLVSLYNSYFGAGSGVLMLVLLLILEEEELIRANALKNLLVGVASVIAAVAFALSGRVLWLGTLPLAAGLFVGGLLGPVIARHLPARILRWTVALLGAAFAVRFWISPT